MVMSGTAIGGIWPPATPLPVVAIEPAALLHRNCFQLSGLQPDVIIATDGGTFA
jgi:hypothetical protein